MKIARQMESILKDHLEDRRVLILLGPRQVGKTTCLKELSKYCEKPVLWLSGDDAKTRELLRNASAANLRNVLGSAKTFILDEAQRIENIGICLKIVADQFPEVKVLATGSSALELANELNEPLTGRKWEFRLFPLSYTELKNHFGFLDEKALLSHRLIYGSYPEVVTSPGKEQRILQELSDSYLYKDILILDRINKAAQLEKLVKALAFQIGNEVSYHELGQMCGLDSQTVEKYISLLEQVFVIFRLNSFSRNLRNELKKSKKFYFYDIGIRNAVLNQFNPLELRNDVGALWENYILSERLKKNHYNHQYVNRYFWRTAQQQEIDYLEECNGEIYAYEFKWNTIKKYKFPSSFDAEYCPKTKEIIHPGNYEEFLSE